MVRKYGLYNFYSFCLDLPDLHCPFYCKHSLERWFTGWALEPGCMGQTLADCRRRRVTWGVDRSAPHLLSLSSGHNIGTYFTYFL